MDNTDGRLLAEVLAGGLQAVGSRGIVLAGEHPAGHRRGSGADRGLVER